MNDHFYRRAQFLVSAASAKQFPESQAREIAFAGRSNAGKSSAINALCDNRSLCRTSKTPGRTQLINFFSIDEHHCLVDLPGYGFAQVPEAMRRDWQKLMEKYLSKRANLVGLVIIMDIRHPLKDTDWQMIEWCRHFGTPLHVLLTKADKLKKSEAEKNLKAVSTALEEAGLEATLQTFSATKRYGIEDLQSVLDEWFERTPQTEDS